MPSHVAKLAATALLLVVTHSIHAQSSASISLDTKDSAFIKSAAGDGLAEVQLGQMALEKSSSASVKKVAQQIVSDHTKVNAQLKTLAASKQVELPSASDAAAQKEGNKLARLSGQPFDKRWTKDIITAHKKAVKIFTEEGKLAKDDDVRQFAQTTLPILQTHLQAATQLAAIPEARDKSMDAMMKSFADDSASAIPASASTSMSRPASSTGSGVKPAASDKATH